MVLSNKKINKIIDFHKSGISIRHIAKKLRISKTTVHSYINKQKNNELIKLNLPLGENLKQKIHVSKPRQPNRESYFPQSIPQHYPVIEDPWPSREQYLEEVEYLRRREEDKQIEQNKKFDQETQEKMHQIEMEIYSTKQQENKRKSLNIINKIILRADESHKKFDADIREVKEELRKKTQEDQQVVDSIPRLVKVNLKKAQEDEIQKSEDQHKPISVSLRQVEGNETIVSDHSGILLESISAGFIGFCEGFDSYRPPDRKPKRVNLVLKR